MSIITRGAAAMQARIAAAGGDVVEFDIAGVAAANSTSETNSFSTDITIGSQANRVLLLFYHVGDSNARPVLSATFDGNAMTEIYNHDHAGGWHYFSAAYYYVAPSTGTYTVQGNHDGTGAEILLQAVVAYNVDQTTPIGQTNTGNTATTGTTVSDDLTGTTADSAVVGVVGHYNEGGSPGFTEGASQTLIHRTELGGWSDDSGISYEGSSGGTITMSASWTNSGGGGDNQHHIFEVLAA